MFEINNRVFLGFLIQVVSVLCNCIAIILLKFCAFDLEGMQLAFYSTLITSLVSFLILQGLNQGKQSIRIFQNTTIPFSLFILIVLSNGLGAISLAYAVKMLHPSVFGLISRFIVIFSVFFSHILLNENTRMKEGLIIAASIIGVILFLYKDETGYTNIDFIGLLVALLYCFFVALAFILIKKYVSKREQDKVVLKMNFFTGCFILLIAPQTYNNFFSETIALINFKIIALLISASVFAIISSILFFRGSDIISYKLSSLIRLLNPIFLLLLSLPFFDVYLSSINILGALITLTSTYFLTISVKK